jgi:hypothetical protein
MFNNLIRSLRTGENEVVASAESSQPHSNSSESLSKEEVSSVKTKIKLKCNKCISQIRRRRLAKVSADEIVPPSSNIVPVDLIPNNVVETKRTLLDTTNDSTLISYTPNSSPMKKIMKDTLSNSSSSKEASKTNATNNSDSSNKIKLDREAIALNLSLENVLQLTLRPEIADSLVYLESADQLLSPSNLSEHICSRLMLKKDLLNAIWYLTACYKRILSKESSASSQKTQDDLIK